MNRIAALILLIVFFPLMMLIWMLVRFTSRGPGLYSSIRLGEYRKPVRVWKFRTMDAAAALEFMASIFDHEEWTSNQKLTVDPRITPVGKWLRRFSVDELPQLWNVLNGSMVLVGPRPITRVEDARYGKYSQLIHSVKPGITGLWQVSGRNLTTYHRRIAINIYYVRHKSWKLDLWILYKTLGAVISGRGAF